MRLSEFILSNLENITQEWEQFAGSLLPEGRHLNKAALRDHLKIMLDVIAADLERPIR